MEQIQKPDQNPFPNFNILKCPPPMEGIARAIAKVLRPIPDLGITHGDHNFGHPTGAAAMLDEHLDEH